MIRSLVVPALTALIVACVGSFGLASGAAEEAGKLPRIGLVVGADPVIGKPYVEAFRRGLREFGYVDGTSVTVFTRYASGDHRRYRALLGELIGLHVDVLVVTTAAVRPALEATKTIPIVCPALGSDPVGEGLVSSLARPGTNITGLYSLGPETDSKRLQLTTETVPALKRAALLFEASDPGWINDAKALRSLANNVGVMLTTYGVRNLAEMQSAFADIDKKPVQALIVFNAPLTNVYREAVMNYAATHRVPVIGEGREWAEAGALLTYSADYVDMYRQSAAYVHKILSGAKPGELPIAQPTKFELFINLKSAKQLGITVPQSVLVRADEVIR